MMIRRCTAACYPVPVIQMLDGIRYAIAMADLSYNRLTHTLAAAFQEPETCPNTFRIATAAFLDAWSMIDSVHRLGKLKPPIPRR
jgi:hypothetical protein